MDNIQALVSKINREYEAMREVWWDMTADELIASAEQIAAAKFVKENIESCISEDEAGYFLSLKDPLEALIDSVMYRYDPQNYAELEWFSNCLYDLCDKRDLDVDQEPEEDEGQEMI